MAVNSATDASNAGATGTTAKTSINAAEDRFLKLLVAQMRNQDPMNPLDNAEVTSQMAQISTVTGIDKLNNSLQTMAASYNAAQSLQAASMIGHAVFAPGNTMQLKEGKAIGGVELAGPADKVTVTVRDKTGFVVDKFDLGPQKEGVLNFKWDGETEAGVASPEGEYTFKIEAIQGGKKVEATALAVGLVTAVTQTKAGATLNVNGVGTVALTDVKQVL